MKQKTTGRWFFYYLVSFVIRERRAFFRDAVFFLITPFFTALSIALYAAERFVFASFHFLSATSFSVVFAPSLRDFFTRSFTAFLRSETRSAFFAFLVIGICAETIARKRLFDNRLFSFPVSVMINP